jgi:hypothetical protein
MLFAWPALEAEYLVAISSLFLESFGSDALSPSFNWMVSQAWFSMSSASSGLEGETRILHLQTIWDWPSVSLFILSAGTMNCPQSAHF